MRKDIFTKCLMLTAILIVIALGVVSGFSLVSLPSSSLGEVAPQGTWHDDSTKTYTMNITHDKYKNGSGADDYITKNLTKVNLTVNQGLNSLCFEAWREKVNNGITTSGDSTKLDGYKVDYGLVLVYINNEIILSENVNFVQGGYYHFNVTTVNYNLQWNSNYEIKLVIAFMFYASFKTYYYKGIASTTVRFNDTVAPTGTLTGVTNGGETNTDVTFEWADSLATAKWSWDGKIYTNSRLEIDKNKEGNHTIVLTDQVGLSNTYTFKIDKTAPASNFNYSLYGGKMYTAGDIVYVPTDKLSKITRMSVKFKEQGEWASSQNDAKRLGYNVQFYDDRIVVPNQDNNGEWYFQSEDSVGNVSAAECVVLMVMSFGNQWRIRDSYKQNTWYNVVLPMNIFGDEAGTYSAASYETALVFATAKEWKFRVSVVPNGWLYVNSANGNLTQLYTERAELDEVVNKYANSYISDRKIAKNGTNVFNNIINDDLILDETALTQQNLAARFFMPLDLPVYFLNASFKFEAPKVAVETFVKIQMIGNDYEAVQRDEVLLNYDVTVGSQIFISNNSQGYYIVTEWDTAGNREQYYVYIDVSAPILEAYATYGDGRKETVTFTEDLVADYAGTFRYISLDLYKLSDLIDEYTTIKITGRKLNEVYFVQGDELPFLDGVEYYGNYTIEMYDRSGNTLLFVISIAGEQPYLSTSSLTSETNCRLTLNVNDSTNSIVELKLYRILYDGTYVQMLQDHKDITVDASTLQYTLTTGGKYTLWYKDLYGRMVECTPIFYVKGLPSGTLSGVIEGGITNRNVSLRFNYEDKLILYRIENGERTVVPESEIFSCVFDETSKKATAYLTANAATSASYVFFLYKADEISLFVEYTFTIDCIIAPIYISNSDGDEVDKDSFTNKPFSIFWGESVTLRYYTNTTPGGELGAVRYAMGENLTTNGTYYFTLRDSVGNEEKFTILLDTIVSYQIDGDFVVLGENDYLSKNDLQFTITEKNAVQLFDPTPAVVNGGLITLEGDYTIHIIDAYGNDVIVRICIDKTAPTVILDGAVNGAYTKNSVTVTALDADAIYLVNKNNQILSAIDDGAIFDNEGSYRIMALDMAGNAAIVTFTINRNIPYESNIADTEITTGAVTFKFLSTLRDEVVLKDNVEIDSRTKYTETGIYSIFAIDDIGNEFYFSFTILPSRMRELLLEDLTDIEIGATKDKLAYSVPVVDGVLTLTEEGSYVLNFKNTKKDLEYSIALTIDNSVSVASNIPNNSFTADTVEVTYGETVTQEVKLEGGVIKAEKKYSKAGNYEIKAVDNLGNEVVLRFRILPARVRELHLENLTDVELLLATKDGDNFAATINENYELHLTGTGHYILFFQRITGEVFNFICDVDDIPPTLDIVKSAGSFKTTNASKENLTATLSCNGAEATAYTVGKKINGAGHYTLTITDDLGNENVYTFDITEPLNWAAYASIGGLGLLGAVALIVVFKARRRIKTR
ncbi:MAG: hypothetical protein NC133_04145 [Prevotella sp.]|nr:hypothetical protein [Prevotella sp.]